MDHKGVFDGLRVLDFGRYIAGPWCAALLGDFGASVIRIDKLGGSEDRFVMPVGHGLDGALFLQVNRNKRSLTLDTQPPAGREVLHRLVAGSDIVVANLPQKALVALGIDYDSLKAIRPDIILTTVTAFGASGPFAEKVGFDVTAQAMSGSMHLTGHADEAMRSYVSWVDFGTATLAAFGTVAAVMERNRSGKGQHVEASLLATALGTANAHLIEQALTQRNRVGSGNRSQISAPADVFRTSDGEIVMQAVGDQMFARWARLVGAEEWIDDPRFATDAWRGDHGELVSARMQAWCDGRSMQEVLARLEAARLPAAPVLTPQQALDHPHIAAAGLINRLPHGEDGVGVPLAATPVDLSLTPGEIRQPAPGTGAQSDEILAELGFNPEEIARLHAAGVV